MEPNEERNVALESARERQVNSANRFFFKKRVARCRHDADYFNRLSLLLIFTYIGASSSVGTSAALSRRRIFGRVLNALSKRITLRPELLCENFVNNRDLGTGLGRLCFGKHATSNHWQSNGRKIIRPDAV